MNYYLPQIDPDTKYIYSCDKVRFRFSFNKINKINDYTSSDLLRYINRIDTFSDDFQEIKHYDSLVAFRYRHFFNFKINDDASFNLAVLFNGANNDSSFVGFIEFNPNKLMQYFQFTSFFAYLKDLTSDWSVVRWDLAIDIPVERKYLRLCKYDKKAYTLIQSDSLTEYLGIHNHHNFTKLYDKTVESNLDYVLTRLEITVEHGKDIRYPDVLTTQPVQLTLDNFSKFSDLNSTYRVLIQLLLDHDDWQLYFGQLSKATKSKIMPYLKSNVIKFNDVYRCRVYSNIIVDLAGSLC